MPDAAGGPRMRGKLKVSLARGSLAFRVYGQAEIEEDFYCSYELNPAFQPLFAEAELRVAGTGEQGEARVVELAGAGFFVGTLFLPQLRPPEAGPHPLIAAYLEHILRAG